MQCESCGIELAEDATFCSACGARAPELASELCVLTTDVAALSERVSALESAILLQADQSKQQWDRIPALEDMERRHRRILCSSSLYSEMFGMRLVTFFGYWLLSGIVVATVLLGLAWATGLLHP